MTLEGLAPDERVQLRTRHLMDGGGRQGGGGGGGATRRHDGKDGGEALETRGNRLHLVSQIEL